MEPDQALVKQFLKEKKLALIVYDMQVGVLNQISGANSIIRKVATILEAARMSGIPTFFTKHLSLPKCLMGQFQLRQGMVWQHTTNPEEVQPWFLRGNTACEITEELTPTPDEAIVEKITMSAFEGTYLAYAMRDLNLSAFIIIGVALEVGIEPTIKHATDLGLIPIVVTDACGFGNKEAADRSLESARYTGDAILCDTESLVRAIESTDAKCAS